MDWIFPLAQAAADSTDVPTWAKYVLGPLGALVLLGVYAIWTERYRMPEIKRLLLAAQAKLEVRCPRERTECEKRCHRSQEDCDDQRRKMRIKYETNEKKLEAAQSAVRSRYFKEKTRRIWWRQKATDLAEKHGEPVPKMPRDIDQATAMDMGFSARDMNDSDEE